MIDIVSTQIVSYQSAADLDVFNDPFFVGYPEKVGFSSVGAGLSYRYRESVFTSDMFYNNFTFKQYRTLILDILPADWYDEVTSEYELVCLVLQKDVDGVDVGQWCIYYRPEIQVYKRLDTYFFSDEELTYDSSDVYFLYDIGKSLINSNNLTDLLNKKIGDTNLITLLFSGGFLVYVSWCIVKWIIPT